MNAAQWWLASLGDTLVWARLRVLEEGVAEVLDASGHTHRYDDATSARMALLDAEFRAFDGLDAEDAAQLGFDLEQIQPPVADTDAELIAAMTHTLSARIKP
ncbi:hypothetical protein [Dokdonella sp.]|uniref:hypothetical protein n=1 Tax=Dokdonella sp. TaxID=2291710 RepID=UPI0031C410B6|nr:hypothetical protein [Dokdonella sp.]